MSLLNLTEYINFVAARPGLSHDMTPKPHRGCAGTCGSAFGSAGICAPDRPSTLSVSRAVGVHRGFRDVLRRVTG